MSERIGRLDRVPLGRRPRFGGFAISASPTRYTVYNKRYLDSSSIRQNAGADQSRGLHASVADAVGRHLGQTVATNVPSITIDPHA